MHTAIVQYHRKRNAYSMTADIHDVPVVGIFYVIEDHFARVEALFFSMAFCCRMPFLKSLVGLATFGDLVGMLFSICYSMYTVNALMYLGFMGFYFLYRLTCPSDVGRKKRK